MKTLSGPCLILQPLLLLFLAASVSGRATIYFRFDSWTSDGTVSTGRSCDPSSTSRLCDYVFKLKLGESGRLGQYESLSFDNAPNIITDFNPIMSQPLVFSVGDIPVPGELLVNIEVYDKNHLADELIIRFASKVTVTAVPFNVSTATSDWITTTRRDGKKRLVTSVKVVCQRNYYGPDCMVYCADRDDDRNGHYTCSRTGERVCRPSYLPPDCITAHPCLFNATCRNRGYCQPEGDSFRCICSRGYSGTRCEVADSPCIGRRCENGGRCVVDPAGSSSRCECTGGWVGPDCSLARVIECDRGLWLASCKNNASCTRVYDRNTVQYGAPLCQCVSGYVGPDCSSPHPCLSNATCNNRGRCIPMNDSYSCECIAGYWGRQCQSDANPCATKKCSNGGSCLVQTASIASCQCTESWGGNDCQFARSISCDELCLQGASCRRSLIDDDGSYGNSTCVVTPTRLADTANLVNGVSGRKEPGYLGVYLSIPTVIFTVMTFTYAIVRCVKKHRKLREAYKCSSSMRYINDRSTATASNGYVAAVIDGNGNCYEAVDNVLMNDRPDSIYDEPAPLLDAESPTSFESPIRQPHLSLNNTGDTDTIVMSLNAEYATPAGAHAQVYSVPQHQSHEVANSQRPLPPIPHASNNYSRCTSEDYLKDGTNALNANKRASNVYSDAPTLAGRQTGQSADPEQSNSACASGSQGNIYSVPSDLKKD